MSGVSSWYAGLVSAALATPLWATVLIAVMVVTTSGRMRSVLHALLLWSPPLTWVLEAAVLAVAFSGWMPGGEVVGPLNDGLSWYIALLYGGFVGFLAWVVCLAGIALGDHVEGQWRFLLGWPFRVVTPLALAVAWWWANQRLGTASTGAFWIAFGGTGAWLLSALWLGVRALPQPTGGAESGAEVQRTDHGSGRLGAWPPTTRHQSTG